MPLNANALTTYATVKDELGLSDDTKQAAVERLINAASAAIEKYAWRSLCYAVVTDEKYRPSGNFRLVLLRTPLVSLTAIDVDGSAVDMTTVQIEDASAGIIRRDSVWERNDYAVGISTAVDGVPDTGEKWVLVDYKGGYVPDAAVWSASRTVVAGSFIRATLASNVTVFQATAAGTTHGTTEPTWPSTLGATVTDNGITWTNVGPRTLPEDLEQACIETVVARYRERGRDQNVLSEPHGDSSRQYSGVNTAIGRGGGLIPDALKATLDSYRRIGL